MKEFFGAMGSRALFGLKLVVASIACVILTAAFIVVNTVSGLINFLPILCEEDDKFTYNGLTRWWFKVMDKMIDTTAVDNGYVSKEEHTEQARNELENHIEETTDDLNATDEDWG